jgi:hypothetical protein
MDIIMTYDDWLASLEKKAEKLPRLQARFSNFEVLPRLGKILEIKSTECAECRMYWQRLQKSTEKLDEFFDDGNSYSKQFDNLVSGINIHLRSFHRIQPKGYILSVYTLTGLLVGVSVGVLLGFLIFKDKVKGMVMMGWLLGVMLGWFLGKIKESNMRRNHQLF